jgi:hypothetical protein
MVYETVTCWLVGTMYDNQNVCYSEYSSVYINCFDPVSSYKGRDTKGHAKAVNAADLSNTFKPSGNRKIH